MTPPCYIRYNAINNLLCKPGKGEYDMCVARTSKKYCENASTTLGSLCPMHARSFHKYRKITTRVIVGVCKGCCEIPVSSGKLCNECINLFCIVGNCRHKVVPGSTKCVSHQPRCATCKKASHVKIGNKYFCNDHHGNCNNCNNPVEIESYRPFLFCKYCYEMKCLHTGCTTIVTERHFCPQHIPNCQIEGCIELMTFYYKGIVRCSTHQPHCYGCDTIVNENTIKHITICNTSTEQYRYYGLNCCTNIPRCQDCGVCAQYEYNESLFKAFCVVHNHICGFPGCRQRIMPLGHYCDDHWVELEIFRILYIYFMNKKRAFDVFISFVRTVGRTRLIRNELLFFSQISSVDGLQLVTSDSSVRGVRGLTDHLESVSESANTNSPSNGCESSRNGNQCSLSAHIFENGIDVTGTH